MRALHLGVLLVLVAGTTSACVGTISSPSSPDAGAAKLPLVVRLPPGSPFRPEDGRVIMDLAEYAVANDGRAKVRIDPSRVRPVVFVVGDLPILAAIIHPTSDTEIVLDARSTALHLIYATTAMSVLPESYASDMLATIDSEVGMASLVAAVHAVVSAGGSPYDVSNELGRNAIVPALSEVLVAFDGWLSAHPIAWPPDGATVRELSMIRDDPAGRRGGFDLLAAPGGDHSIVITVRNERGRAGVAIVDREEPLPQSRLASRVVAPARFEYWDTIDSLFGASHPPIIPKDTPLDPITTLGGLNAFRVTIVAPSRWDTLPPGSPYADDYRIARNNTYWALLIQPILLQVLGGIDARCIDEALAWAKSGLFSIWAHDVRPWEALGDLPAAIDYAIDSAALGGCISGSTFAKKLAKYLAKVAAGVWLVEIGTNVVLNLLSTIIDAPILVSFRVEACDSASGLCETSCACSSGACCDGCNYLTSASACEVGAVVETGCPGGTACGSSPSVRRRDRYCSGDDATCAGELGPWGAWEPLAICASEQRCNPDGSCVPCCAPGAYEACFAGDVYSFDACGAPESLVTSCGTCGCSSGACLPCGTTYHFEADPPVGTFTSAFTPSTSCTCASPGDCLVYSTCNAYWRAKVIAFDLATNTVSFEYSTGDGLPISTTEYAWIRQTVVPDPSCSAHLCSVYRLRVDPPGGPTAGASSWVSPPVNLSTLASQPCGSEEMLYLATTPGMTLDSLAHYQPQATVIRKICP